MTSTLELAERARTLAGQARTLADDVARAIDVPMASPADDARRRLEDLARLLDEEHALRTRTLPPPATGHDGPAAG